MSYDLETFLKQNEWLIPASSQGLSQAQLQTGEYSRLEVWLNGTMLKSWHVPTAWQRNAIYSLNDYFKIEVEEEIPASEYQDWAVFAFNYTTEGIGYSSCYSDRLRPRERRNLHDNPV